MNRRDIGITLIATGLLLPTIALLQRIPRAEGFRAAETKEATASIRRDRPEEVGNETAEHLLMNVEKTPCIPKTGRIELQDDTFSPGYDELYDHRADYYGREIEFSGYVRTDNVPEGQFLLGRDVLWCCEADKYYIGFLILSPGAIPQEGAEVRVRGTIEPVLYTNAESGKSFTVPAIREESRIAAPKFSRQVLPR